MISLLRIAVAVMLCCVRCALIGVSSCPVTVCSVRVAVLLVAVYLCLWSGEQSSLQYAVSTPDASRGLGQNFLIVTKIHFFFTIILGVGLCVQVDVCSFLLLCSYLHTSMELNSTDWKFAVHPATNADCAVGVLWRDILHVSNWSRSCLPGFKDFHLPDMSVSAVLVIGQNADLKQKCLYWPGEWCF